jgi:catechol 2,3-dioxygenase-like lactoylglutathione lyase family enzyme
MRWFSLVAISAMSTVSVFAQLAPPNEMGVSIGHIHMMLGDPDAQKKIWVGVLGAEVTSAGSLEMLKFPGVFIVLQKARTAPAEGSDGSSVNHFGFLVKSYADTKKKLEAAGLTFSMDNAQTKQIIAVLPEKVRVEFTEDAALTVPIKFHHIHEAGENQEAVRDWYVKTFGATAGKRGQFPAAFIPGGEVDVMKATAAPAPTKGRSLDHIGFEVKDLEAFCKKLAADGVAFDMKYTVIPQLAGLKIAFIVDPNGTRIELTEGLSAH